MSVNSVNVACMHFIIGHNSTVFNMNSSDVFCQGNCSSSQVCSRAVPSLSEIHTSVVLPVAVMLCIIQSKAS